MEYNKVLSEHFCQAAVLALRDWAVEFETANHVLYKYPPTNPHIDSFGYFVFSAYNEVRWWKIAENISKSSALYIPIYAQLRGLDPKNLSDADARQIFLYLMIAELEDGNRVTSMVNDYDTGFGYEGVLYALYAMGEEKAMQGFAKMSPEIKNLWGVDSTKNEPVDYAGMMSLEKHDISTNEQAVELRAKMLNILFGNLLRENLFMHSDLAKEAFSIQWDDVIDYETEGELKRFIESHPDDYRDPDLACEAFFAALNAASKAAPLVQLINQTDIAELKLQMLNLLPSYITYFKQLCDDQFSFYCALTASPKEDYEPLEFDEDNLLD